MKRGMTRGILLLAAALCFCTTSVSAKAKKEKAPKAAKVKKEKPPKAPKPKAGESVTNSLGPKRTGLTDKTFTRKAPVSDPEDASFFAKHYTDTTTVAWNCHDPKLYQDPDTGVYYVYSTGWETGVQVRSSKDALHWTRYEGAFFDEKDISLRYRNMWWDDDFLKWVGFDTNDGTRYGTNWYTPTARPHSWAPTVVKQDGKYYMFHGIITDSLSSGGVIHPAACISMSIADKPEGPFIPATKYAPDLYKNASLVRYVWTNVGAQNSMIGYNDCNNSAGDNWLNGFGCIDPEFVTDVATGELVKCDVAGNECYAMTYGSWKGGIALVYVDAATFKPVNETTGEEMDAPVDSIKGNCGTLIVGGAGAAYEGAQLIYNSETGYYYIFVSMGDLNIQYRVGVGRSKEMKGPYVDTKGVDMKFMNGGQASGYHGIGGKIIGAYQLGNDYGFTSPGGQSILRDKSGHILFACHTRTNFMPLNNFALQVRQMFFNADGWPVLNMNEYYGEDAAPKGLKMSDIAGEYDAILTKRHTSATIDGDATTSKPMTISASGDVSGSYSGKATLDADGLHFTLDLGETGVFKGIAMKAHDLARKGVRDIDKMATVTFTTVNPTNKGAGRGEYLFGNKK